MSKSRVFIATLAFMTCLIATGFPAGKNGTIILDDGRRIDDTEYKIVKMYKIIEVVKIEGVAVKIKYSFNRISALLDEDGVDVTEKYLGKYAVRKSSPNPNKTKPTSEASEAKSAKASSPTESPPTPTDGNEATTARQETEIADAPTPASSPPDTLRGDSESETVRTGLHESEQTTPIPARRNTPGETWRTDRARQRQLRPSYQRLWNFGIRVGSNFSIPTGQFYDGITSGPGFGADFMVPITHELAFRGTVSKSGMKWDDNFGFFFDDPTITIVAQDNSFNATRISAAAEYYFYNREGEFPPKVVGFFYSGLGAIVHDITSTITARDNTTSQVATVTVTDSFTEFILVTGVGADLMFSPSFGLEVAGTMDIVVLGSKGASTPQYAYVFDLRLGVISLF